MKTYFTTLVLTISLFISLTAKSQPRLKATVPAKSIIKNMSTLMDYNRDHLRLNIDFIAYDAQAHIVTKTQFLKAITTGDYLPLKVSSGKKAWEYQLYKLDADADSDVKSMLKQIGVTYYGFNLMVGKPFPKFHYIDLNGNVYTPENTKGKILVLKGWFISCVPCVAEMPELNKLTEQYKNRKDILFVSMATDTKKALQGFMKRMTFKYAVVPVKAAYIENTLHTTGYPVHWIINKQGIVVSMTYDHAEMIAALHQEALKK
ncbi:MAG: TlpA disulfide reductase family protein [Bacteroidota bacterium]